MFAKEKRSWRIGSPKPVVITVDPNDSEIMRRLDAKRKLIESRMPLADRMIDYGEMRYKLRRKIRIARKLKVRHSRGLQTSKRS